MPFQEDLYERRTVVAQAATFVETPIFIGTANKLVSISSQDGSRSISVLNSDDGLLFNFDLTEATVTYWKKVGNYSVGSIDNTRKKLTLITNVQSENIDTSQRKYTCFILDSDTNIIIASVSLASVVFQLMDTTTKNISSIILNESIPSNIDITLSKYNIVITYVDVINIDSSFLAINNNIVTIDNSKINSFGSNNLHQYIDVKWQLYYKIIDFRYYTINQNDTISDEIANHKNNNLGMALARHQAMSTTKATLLTIPSEDDTCLTFALTIIQDNELGYYIVPLFVNNTMGPLLRAWSEQQFKDTLFFYNIIASPLILTRTLIEASKTL